RSTWGRASCRCEGRTSGRTWWDVTAPRLQVGENGRRITIRHVVMKSEPQRHRGTEKKGQGNSENDLLPTTIADDAVDRPENQRNHERNLIGSPAGRGGFRR